MARPSLRGGGEASAQSSRAAAHADDQTLISRCGSTVHSSTPSCQSLQDEQTHAILHLHGE